MSWMKSWFPDDQKPTVETTIDVTFDDDKTIALHDQNHTVLPTRLEVLGDHLFYKVVMIDERNAHKIVSILVDMGTAEVLTMLEQPLLLKRRVKDVRRRIITSLQDKDCERARLGEQLFDIIEILEPIYSGSITGMLMELDTGMLQLLTKNPDALRDYIAKTKALLTKRSKSITPRDRVRDMIMEVHPQQAGKLTRMFMKELGKTDVEDVMKDKMQFWKILRLCKSSLDSEEFPFLD